MLYLAIALTAIVLLLIALRERDARQIERILADAAIERRTMLAEHRGQIESLLSGAATERQTLLNRIQHPERPVVPIVERESIEPPRDSAELACVGGIVPEGVQVGREPDGDD